ncbi:MAG: alpha/beta hydrolase [Formivibrio sp.]|nr:alpha/beta hydrolase [Formivibrio sp.]
MESRVLSQTEETLIAAASRYEFVLIPGRYDSSQDHWQSYWQNQLPIWQRLTQRNWNDPDIERWIGSLRRLLAPCKRRAILVGHSLGALASCCVAVDHPDLVAGLMLVAPAEPGKFEVEDRVPVHDLGVPSILVASHNDPFMSLSRAEHWASVWRSDLVDIGEAGHINVESGFGRWPYGLEIIRMLVEKADQAFPAPR